MTTHKTIKTGSDIRPAVRKHYAEAIKKSSGCCGGGANCGCGSSDKDTSYSGKGFYEESLLKDLPEDISAASLGCGNPVALASLKPGQTVLDLGSGGGLDCFLAAKQVGTTGRVIGVDMTPEMIDQARKNRVTTGLQNVEFRLGEIEHLPVSDASVDVVISNCVINLSPDKPQVFAEIFRALKPGGRIAVSDIVLDGDLPDNVRESLNAWAGCIAGALQVAEVKKLLTQTGFTNISLVPMYYSPEMLADIAKTYDLQGEFDASTIRKKIFSADISAIKP
jgi:arsenite methyltransferase